MTVQVTSADIADKIAALDVALEDWEREADEKSLAAVAGDKAAAKKLAEINAHIEHARADRIVLERASKKAVKAEAAAAARAEAEAREQSIAQARHTAAKLVETAKRADALIAELKAVLPELSELESGIWHSLGRARMHPPGALVGRRDLTGIGIDALQAFLSGRFQHNNRSLAETAGIGWRFLLEPDNEKEAA